MAEQQEQKVITGDEPDLPVSGDGSRTGRAVALARLLHHECTQLLRLFVSYELTVSFYLPYSLLTVCRPLVGACR